MPQGAVIGLPGHAGHVSPAALSQTVKMKSKRGAPGCENSSQLFERKSCVSKPSSLSRESACGWTSPLGKLPALKARKRPSPDRKSVVSGKSVSVRVDLGGRRIIKK